MPEGGAAASGPWGRGWGCPQDPRPSQVQTWNPGERRRAVSDPWWSSAELQARGTWRPRGDTGCPGLGRQEPPWAAAPHYAWRPSAAPRQGCSGRGSGCFLSPGDEVEPHRGLAEAGLDLELGPLREKRKPAASEGPVPPTAQAAGCRGNGPHVWAPAGTAAGRGCGEGDRLAGGSPGPRIPRRIWSKCSVSSSPES